jgi:hypothetical protein
MIPVPAFKTVCGVGVAMTACPIPKVLVTASDDDLTVFALPDSIAASGFARIRTIGGGGCVQPLNFKFVHDDWVSGELAFTGATASTRLLLVTDAGNKAVHVIDVVHGAHVGYVAAPGSIYNPTNVAARDTKVAVSMRNGRCRLPWVRKFTATPNSPILPLEPIDFLQEGWR